MLHEPQKLAEYHRRRAAKLRKQAERYASPEARKTFLDMARGCDNHAADLESRAALMMTQAAVEARV